jgi:dTDP-4-dehydrorhamnose reductase
MRRAFLLLGADGLVGRHLSAALPADDTVRTYHHDPPGNGLGLDITDADAVRAAIAQVRPRVIFLAAADAYVERCEREPAATRRVNVEAPRAVAESIAATDALLVVARVADASRGRDRMEDPYSPGGRFSPALT